MWDGCGQYRAITLRLTKIWAFNWKSDSNVNGRGALSKERFTWLQRMLFRGAWITAQHKTGGDLKSTLLRPEGLFWKLRCRRTSNIQLNETWSSSIIGTSNYNSVIVSRFVSLFLTQSDNPEVPDSLELFWLESFIHRDMPLTFIFLWR